jgi:ADP-ribosylglycohydrolase
MIGAVVGDVVGSVYEFDNYRAKDFTPFFHRRAFITDDTVCTVAVADILLTGNDPASTLKRWCLRYWKIGGWGGRFASWVQANDVAPPYGSFGNGAAMRISPAGFLGRDEQEVLDMAHRVTAVTHDHPEGIKGAQATALAIHWSRNGVSIADIRQEVEQRFDYDLSRSVDQIRAVYRYTESSQGTVPEALSCALAATDFEDGIRNAISIGGDSDTIAAIAGGIVEARFGVPEAIRTKAIAYLPEEMQRVLDWMYTSVQ